MSEDLIGAGSQMHDSMRATELVSSALEIIDDRVSSASSWLMHSI